MPTYEIIFRDRPRGRSPADGRRRTRTAIVFDAVQQVVLTPREVVVRRLTAAEVDDVRELEKRRAMVTGDGYRV